MPYFVSATPSTRPATLHLVQVRLPPGYAANAPPQRPNQVHSALYSRGVLFLAASSASDNDVVWTLSNALFPATQQLCETQSTFGLDGKTWALSEVTIKKSSSTGPGLPPPAPEPPLIVSQHMLPPRRFVFLTTQCCHVVTQLRPVDILRQLLVDASGPDSTAVRAFFQVLREDQACATALILACSTSVQDSQVANWAAQALYLHGGDIKVAPLSNIASPGSPFLTSPGPAPNYGANTPGNMQQQPTVRLLSIKFQRQTSIFV